MQSYHPLRQVRFDLGRPVVRSTTAEDGQARITELLARGEEASQPPPRRAERRSTVRATAPATAPVDRVTPLRPGTAPTSPSAPGTKASA